MFKCETCEKVFSTRLALGGHKGSHSRDTEDYRRRRKLGLDKRPCSECGIETVNPKFCSLECRGRALRVEVVTLYRVKDACVRLDISKEDLKEYRVQQKVCEICGIKPTKTLAIDHDHETNKFRGLLCSVCNRQLGWFENNQHAIRTYLDR